MKTSTLLSSAIFVATTLGATAAASTSTPTADAEHFRNTLTSLTTGDGSTINTAMNCLSTNVFTYNGEEWTIPAEDTLCVGDIFGTSEQGPFYVVATDGTLLEVTTTIIDEQEVRITDIPAEKNPFPIIENITKVPLDASSDTEQKLSPGVIQARYDVLEQYAKVDPGAMGPSCDQLSPSENIDGCDPRGRFTGHVDKNGEWVPYGEWRTINGKKVWVKFFEFVPSIEEQSNKPHELQIG